MEQFLRDFQDDLVFANPNGNLFPLKIKRRVLFATPINPFTGERSKTNGEAVVGVVHVEVELRQGS